MTKRKGPILFDELISKIDTKRTSLRLASSVTNYDSEQGRAAYAFISNKYKSNFNQKGTKGELDESKGNSNAIKEEPDPDQRGTKGELKEELSRSKGNSNAIKGELDKKNTEINAKHVSNLDAILSQNLPVPLLDPPVPLLNSSSSPLNLTQFPFENRLKGELENPVPLLNSPSSPLQRGTVNPLKGELLPDGNQERLILLSIAEKQAEHGGQRTPRMRRLQISISYDIPLESVKTQLKRLIKKGYVELVDAKRGRGKCGCIYRIPAPVFSAILGCKEELKGNRKGEPNRNQRGTSPYVSSSSLNITTTDNSQKTFLKKLSVLGDRWGISRFNIGTNDLLSVWRLGGFESEEEFVESVEHIAFYLDSPEAKTLKSHKAWALQELKKGYYARPAKFESLEERHERLKFEAAQSKIQNLQDLKKRRLEAEFEVWFEELSEEQLKAYLKPYPAISNPNSLMAKEILRDLFSQHGGVKSI